MEGIFYYWMMWVAWIITTFFMKKQEIRTKLTIFLLVNIWISEIYWVIGHFHIRVSLLLFLGLGYYLSVKKNNHKSFFHYMMILALTFAYASILLFYIYDPVWFVFDYRLIVSITVSVLAIYLGKHIVQKYAIYLLAVCQGELIYWFILGKFHNGLIIGTADFLDIAVIGCVIIYLWTTFQQIIFSFEQIFEKPAKEKQG